MTLLKPSDPLSLKPISPLEPSLLFSKTITFLLSFIKFLAKDFSTGSTPTLASMTNIIKSDSSMANSVWSLISVSVLPVRVSSIPAVSIKIKFKSTRVAFPYFLSLVTPGRLLTIALFELTKRLNKVDFPTLGLPTKAILIIFLNLKY